MDLLGTYWCYHDPVTRTNSLYYKVIGYHRRDMGNDYWKTLWINSGDIEIYTGGSIMNDTMITDPHEIRVLELKLIK
jgi:hypothetical protein